MLSLLLLRWLPEAILERAESELRAKFLYEKATTDSMTGLLTRAQFLSLAEAEWRRCRRQKRPLTLVMIDIDHFKSINDDYGHSAGDQVIVRVTKLCGEAKRSSDIAGRLGGEEFVILLSETAVADAGAFAERLRNIIASDTTTETEGKIPATVSIGISDAEGTNSLAEFLKRADVALYDAKHGGRNRVYTYTAPKPQSSDCEVQEV